MNKFTTQVLSFTLGLAIGFTVQGGLTPNRATAPTVNHAASISCLQNVKAGCDLRHQAVTANAEHSQTTPTLTPDTAPLQSDAYQGDNTETLYLQPTEHTSLFQQANYKVQ